MRKRTFVRVPVPAAVYGLAVGGAALAVAIALDAHDAVLVAGALAFTGVAIALVLGHRAMASRGLAALERRVTSLTRGDEAAPAPSRDPAVSRLDGALSGLAAAQRLRLAETEAFEARLSGELEQRVEEATRRLREETSTRQKAERRLRQTQKMEAISRLTGGIAHDLNNKLMVIGANIDAVTRHVKDEPQLRRKLIAALVASDQAASLISKLLAFAQQRDLSPQYIDVASHLASITSLLERSFLSDGVAVHLVIPEELWPVEVDPHELETAIVNLGVNARDAMSAGGTITIEARNHRLAPGSGTDLFGDFVRIEIRDTGVGIPAERIEHVFEPFYTTKGPSRASGLGLSQVHGFARQLGGTVDIESEVGEGTTVTLYLPRAGLAALAGARRQADEFLDDEVESAALGEVLVVDDEVEVALALEGMLKEAGYRVRTAIGADEAIDSLRAKKPDIVLTDVAMPGTMDGIALAREIRRMHADLPVVLITGNPSAFSQESEFPLLSKPIVGRALNAALQRCLAGADDGKVIPLFGQRGRRPS
jgi:signal transduction histidine kinase/CheY-like chemotaxis protein